jgi:HptB-dependent secretion and biofilm anti anti-sigma factor
MPITVDWNAGCIAVGGELTFTDQGPFKEMITELFQAKGAAVVIDLSKLEMIDSAGLGMLLLAREEAKKSERKLILAHPTGQVKRMFGVTKFDKLFTVQD